MKVKRFSGYSESSPLGTSYYPGQITSDYILKPLEEGVEKYEDLVSPITSERAKDKTKRVKKIVTSLRKLIKQNSGHKVEEKQQPISGAKKGKMLVRKKNPSQKEFAQGEFSEEDIRNIKKEMQGILKKYAKKKVDQVKDSVVPEDLRKVGDKVTKKVGEQTSKINPGEVMENLKKGVDKVKGKKQDISTTGEILGDLKSMGKKIKGRILEDPKTSGSNKEIIEEAMDITKKLKDKASKKISDYNAKQSSPKSGPSPASKKVTEEVGRQVTTKAPGTVTENVVKNKGILAWAKRNPRLAISTSLGTGIALGTGGTIAYKRKSRTSK